MRTLQVLTALAALALPSLAIDKENKIPAGSKVYVQPMDGFGSYVTAALTKKNVPVVVVVDREKADYEITGDAQSQKAGWAKILFTRSVASTEEACRGQRERAPFLAAEAAPTAPA